MWFFLTRRLRMWVLLAIVLPLGRVLVHRLALAANERRHPTLHIGEPGLGACGQRK